MRGPGALCSHLLSVAVARPVCYGFYDTDYDGCCGNGAARSNLL